MADNFVCILCGRTFKSGSGLSSHMRAKHPDAGGVRKHGDDLKGVVPDDGDGEDGPLPSFVIEGGISRHERPELAGQRIAEWLTIADSDMLDWACKELAIDPENVMAYKVYDDRVVIIEGPVGYKRTFLLPELEEDELDFAGV